MEHLEQQFSDDVMLTTSRHETQSSNSVREYSNPPIPDDLLVEIFSRVPAKSIARFRCVSKILASILRRHDFTEMFLTMSLTRPRLLFTIRAKGKLFFYSALQPHNPDDNSSFVATRYHPPSVPNYRPSYISKPVCGLVLLLGWGRRQWSVICNPTKGKVRNLPKVPRKEKYTLKGIFLGYDPIGKQLKVLCLSMNNSLYSTPNNTHWILTLETGKCLWRRLEPELNFKEDILLHGDICINGVLYFEARFEKSFVIVCFDVRSEKFGIINKDEDMPFDFFSSSSTLFNYKDKLGIHCQVEEKLVLWVLEDAGNQRWSKHVFVLSPLGCEIVTGYKFRGMISTGEIVYSWHSCLFFYNLERNTFSRTNKGLKEVEHHEDIVGDTFVDYVENMKFM